MVTDCFTAYFYKAELVQEDGRYAVVLDKAKVFLSDEKQAKLNKNNVKTGAVTLGVRPEHLLLTGDPASMISGKVDVSEMKKTVFTSDRTEYNLCYLFFQIPYISSIFT